MKKNNYYSELSVSSLELKLKTLTKSRSFVVAYSGGVDSHALLALMAELKVRHSSWQLQAVHINHGLSPYADAWQQHCREICIAMQIPLECVTAKIHCLPGESVEAKAREIRYALLANHLPSGGCLLTAHNQDDQAETLVLQLLRGAGVKGLSAMPISQIFAGGYLLRPLLDFPRACIEIFARCHGLSWIEDESNCALRFDRNFLRQQIFPLLRDRWPQLSHNIARSARHAAEASALLDELAQQDLLSVLTKKINQLYWRPLLELSTARQRNMLRYWIRQNQFRLPSTQQLRMLIKTVLFSQQDKAPEFTWDNVCVRRFRDKLILLPQQSLPAITAEFGWDLATPLILPANLGVLSVTKLPAAGLKLDIRHAKFSIRFRQGGERCRPAGSAHTRELKKLLQQWGVPPWQRNQIPLLYCDNELASVIGYCICEGFAASATEWGLQIIWDEK